MKKIYMILLFCLGLTNLSAEDYKFTDKVVGLDTPWEILWGPDDYIWMTERSGRVSRVDPVLGSKQLLLTVGDVFEDGERGLMGMVLDPSFMKNGFVYIAYNYLAPGNGSQNDRSRIRIARYRYNGTQLVEPNTVMEDIKGWWNHDGCRLWIDGQMKLWATVGDAAHSELAQDINSKNGKVLRMNLDGSAPDDNPYAGAQQGDPYVWSYGHRNQQGLVFAKGLIYASEHGLNTNDEINIIEKGRNYGWPEVEGFCDGSEATFCEENNVKEPLAIFEESRTYAVAGLDYYDHELIPMLKNSLLMTSLKDHRLTVINLNESGDQVVNMYDIFTLENNPYRLRDLCISPDGRVFIATSECDGRGDCPGGNYDKIILMEPAATSVEKKKDDMPVVEIFPNPGNGIFRIETGFPVDKIEIYDMSGHMLGNYGASAGRMEINAGNLSNGTYFVKVSNGTEVRVAKLNIIR